MLNTKRLVWLIDQMEYPFTVSFTLHFNKMCRLGQLRMNVLLSLVLLHLSSRPNWSFGFDVTYTMWVSDKRCTFTIVDVASQSTFLFAEMWLWQSICVELLSTTRRGIHKRQEVKKQKQKNKKKKKRRNKGRKGGGQVWSRWVSGEILFAFFRAKLPCLFCCVKPNFRWVFAQYYRTSSLLLSISTTF